MATAPTSSKETSGGGIAGRLVPVLFVAVALGAFFAFDLDRYFTLETLRENREALQAWVAKDPLIALGIFVAAYAAAVAISFPGASILTVFGGFLFGLWPGVPAIVVAATIGATIIFLISKSSLGSFLKERAGGLAARMEQGFQENALSYMLILRLAPIFPFWGVNIAAGLLGVSTRTFILGTFFGIIPGSFVYASIGNAAGAAFDAGEDVSLSGILLKPETLLPIAGLIILAVIPIILKRTNKSLQETGDTSPGGEQ
ncbi:MAG: TVP38/TMEM64 family protein [Pseudomonadota bacterium]